MPCLISSISPPTGPVHTALGWELAHVGVSGGTKRKGRNAFTCIYIPADEKHMPATASDGHIAWFPWIITRPHCMEGWKWFDLIKKLPQEKHFSSWPYLPDLRKSAAKKELTWCKVITCVFHVTRAVGFKNLVRVLQRGPGPCLSLWPRSLEPGGSATRTVGSDLLRRHIPQTALAPGLQSVGQWDNAVCGCVFVWGSVLFWSITPLRIWYPAGCRGWMIAQLAELLMGAFFFCIGLHDRK